jgi:Arc/MetJ-type ribon-helix-helix transcriptional regulator
MTLHLTPEQERRIQAVIGSGAYESIEEVLEAALSAVEQRTNPEFDGTNNELEALLLEGLDSDELPEKEFWESVDKRTAMLSDHKSRLLS